MSRDVNVLYFAWIRERIGVASESIQTNAETLRELVEELSAKEDRYALAFSDVDVIRAALDQELVELDAPLGAAKEVAFFPPMTGG